jgi:plastocyanin
MNMTRFFAALVFCASASFAQAQIAASFTVSHSGLAPSPEATVNVGDTVKFIYGGGGPHPMTSGHNQTPSPTFFPTVTVTSGSPEATTTLEEPGVYYFHCGTNPGNSNNWGTLTVVDPNNPTSISNPHVPTWALQSNLVRNEVVLTGEGWPDEVVLYGMTGQVVNAWNPSSCQGILSVGGLSQGLYVLAGKDGTAWTLWIQP